MVKNISAIISIGVNQMDFTILKEIASPGCFIKAGNFSPLDQTIDQLVPMVCSLGKT